MRRYSGANLASTVGCCLAFRAKENVLSLKMRMKKKIVCENEDSAQKEEEEEEKVKDRCLGFKADRGRENFDVKILSFWNSSNGRTSQFITKSESSAAISTSFSA